MHAPRTYGRQKLGPFEDLCVYMQEFSQVAALSFFICVTLSNLPIANSRYYRTLEVVPNVTSLYVGSLHLALYQQSIVHYSAHLPFNRFLYFLYHFIE